MARYVGKRIVPKHCGYWDNTKTYEMESIVYDRANLIVDYKEEN